MTPERGAADAAWPRRIDSHADFVAAFHATLTLAQQRQARRIVWADPDFADWPLDDAALWPCLSRWLRLPQRRLLLLARDYDAVARRCPRFVAGYRLWSHAIQAFSPAPDDAVGMPTVLLADDLAVVQIFDVQRWRGRASSDAAELRPWADRLDALLQRSAPAFAATTLGI